MCHGKEILFPLVPFLLLLEILLTGRISSAQEEKIFRKPYIGILIMGILLSIFLATVCVR
jgi:hypothetical protein